MKTEIVCGKLCEIPETEEEAQEMIWPKKEREEFHINERLDEVRLELQCANDAVGEYLGQNEVMLQKAEDAVVELKQERMKLKRRLRELAEK
tara:strand:- start:128 stop:403 length:276 start_codon:yes stop_codon:yes gene_type:complete